MITRTSQTVLESRLLTSVPTYNGDNHYQVRCLYAGSDLARFIVVNSNDIQTDQYQIQILAEARFSFRKNRLAFKSQSLTTSVTEILQKKIYSLVKQEFKYAI